jgi:hypothetical protein
VRFGRHYKNELQPLYPVDRGPWKPVDGHEPWRTRVERHWDEPTEKEDIALYHGEMHVAEVRGGKFRPLSLDFDQRVPLPVLVELLRRAGAL